MDESCTGPQAGRAGAIRKIGSNEAAVPGTGGLDYGAFDIEIDDEENIGASTEEELGYATTPQ
jgi:hypothetical protein